jgi:hypothetical protein
MKAAEYMVIIVFSADSGEYIGTPHSRCGCPVGRNFCSHMLGFVIMLDCLQNERELGSVQEFKDEVLPFPIRSMAKIPIALVFLFKKGSNKNRFSYK